MTLKEIAKNKCFRFVKHFLAPFNSEPAGIFGLIVVVVWIIISVVGYVFNAPLRMDEDTKWQAPWNWLEWSTAVTSWTLLGAAVIGLCWAIWYQYHYAINMVYKDEHKGTPHYCDKAYYHRMYHTIGQDCPCRN